MKKITLLVLLASIIHVGFAQNTFLITADESNFLRDKIDDQIPMPGDTIFIDAGRTTGVQFVNMHGSPDNPIVVTNKNGAVKIYDPGNWGAIQFKDCSYIHFTGTGSAENYGFTLTAREAGVALTELSTDIEVDHVKITMDGFFGIVAKKDYGGNPPTPAPVFANLIIHDCFIEGVSEGMYLGETKSPGMEFKHVRIYNNIVRNTGREAIQIANMVEDVEVYNNTLLNSGLNREYGQGNNLQVGDNTSAKVYNNIMMEAYYYGIALFGKGNNFFANNYISSGKGMFADNRKFSDVGAPVIISGNYFTNVRHTEVVRIMNEYLNFEISNNIYDTDVQFFKNESGNDNNYVLSNNQLLPIDSIIFVDPENGDYNLAPGTLDEFLKMGATVFLDNPGIDVPDTITVEDPDPVIPEVPDTINTEDPDPIIPEVPDTIDSEIPTVYSGQIILTPDMIVDEVVGGSLNSANYLVDEQTSTPENGLHPKSQSWKPAWNMNNGPYHFYIDLGKMYQVTNISLHDMNDSKNLEVSIGEPGNWQVLFTENCDGYNTWKQHETNATTRYIRLSMNESVYACVNEIIVSGFEITDTTDDSDTPEESETPADLETPTITTSGQILLNATMLVDEVLGGSLDSPTYLVDEQSRTPENESHPNSKSWKPYRNMDNGSYHVYIDLGKMFRITNISLHDMNDSKNLEVSVGEPGNWQALFTENCDGYNAWKQHDTDVATRYIRLSMVESVYAFVNEIVVYGYEEVDDIQLKSGSISLDLSGEKVSKEIAPEPQVRFQKEFDDKPLKSNISKDFGNDLTNEVFASVAKSTSESKIFSEPQVRLVQNPVNNLLELCITEELSDGFNIEIFDTKGLRIYSENFTNNHQSQILIDLGRLNMQNGLYILRYSNQSRICKNIKFIKQSY